MAWVMGIREAHYVEVPVDEERHGPIAHRRERRITELPSSAIAGTVQRGHWLLPLYTGAGPCGTLARDRGHPGPGVRAVRMYRHADGTMLQGGSLSWSFRRLVVPLQAYYAAYVRPLKFGPKTGPRGRRAA